jgi:hypothetical protein
VGVSHQWRENLLQAGTDVDGAGHFLGLAFGIGRACAEVSALTAVRPELRTSPRLSDLLRPLNSDDHFKPDTR